MAAAPRTPASWIMAAMAAGEILYDDLVTGLFVRAKPSGKMFFLQYRSRKGDKRCPKLGEGGKMKLSAV